MDKEVDISAELEQIKEFSNYQEGDPISVTVKDNAIRISCQYIRPSEESTKKSPESGRNDDSP